MNQVNTELKRLVRSLKNIQLLSDQELANLPHNEYFTWDIEVYKNLVFVGFKHLRTGKCVGFEMSERCPQINKQKLMYMLWRNVFIDFNGDGYDRAILTLILNGASIAEIKEASDIIIREDVKKWDLEKRLGIKLQKMNHIDLMEVAPLSASLKMYAARINSKRLQDLPFHHDKVLTQEEQIIVIDYCYNDLDLTEDLLTELWPHIKIRVEMSEKYGIDLRSKSDAQIAEAVVKHEIFKLTGKYPKKPNHLPSILKYNCPPNLKFETAELQNLLKDMLEADFYLGAKGPLAPATIEGRAVKVNGMPYSVGMGGLHSKEKSIFHFAQEDEEISDNDVESYYPRLILNQRLFPAHIGEAFLEIYEKIVNTRLKAKKDGDKKVSDMLKIVINGLFGKLGDLYSSVVSPQLMLQVTITGQLYLLKLIEMFELAGINVISANTDGVVSKYKKSNREKVRKIIAEWELLFELKTEETQYRFLAAHSCNNYLAGKLKFDKVTKQWLNEIEECKTKGYYARVGSALNSPLSKNPEYFICSEAIQQFLLNKTPLEKTIKNCNDIKEFIFVRNVKGGAKKDDVYLGKVVRWYMPTNKTGPIRYVGSGNGVANSNGACPLMDLPDSIPADLDYDFYVKKSVEMLYDVGYYRKVENASLF